MAAGSASAAPTGRHEPWLSPSSRTTLRLHWSISATHSGPIRAFVTVTLPLMAPGILAGAVLAFARSLGEFGATITFVSNIPGETQTLPSALYTFTQVPGGDAGALRLSLVAVAISMLALVAAEVLGRRLARRLEGA